jgi:tetratricopeptide (TPR) repeat protein
LAKGRISAQELKHDPLMDQYLTTRGWIKDRMRHLLTGLIVAAVIVAAGLLFWQIKTRRERSAAEELADAFKISAATVANPIPPNMPGYAFTSEDEKNRRAYEAFEKAARDYPSFNRDVARYQGAMHQLNFDAPKAEATLKELASGNSDVASQAKLALGQYYQRNARFDEALTQYQQLKSNPGSVPPVAVDLAMARIYDTMGKTSEAIELYLKVATETKRAGLGTYAMNRLTILAPEKIDAIPMPEISSPLAGMR